MALRANIVEDTSTPTNLLSIIYCRNLAVVIRTGRT